MSVHSLSGQHRKTYCQKRPSSFLGNALEPAVLYAERCCPFERATLNGFWKKFVSFQANPFCDLSRSAMKHGVVEPLNERILLHKLEKLFGLCFGHARFRNSLSLYELVYQLFRPF